MRGSGKVRLRQIKGYTVSEHLPYVWVRGTKGNGQDRVKKKQQGSFFVLVSLQVS